jgi:hypothetical protein
MPSPAADPAESCDRLARIPYKDPMYALALASMLGTR